MVPKPCAGREEEQATEDGQQDQEEIRHKWLPNEEVQDGGEDGQQEEEDGEAGNVLAPQWLGHDGKRQADRQKSGADSKTRRHQQEVHKLRVRVQRSRCANLRGSHRGTGGEQRPRILLRVVNPEGIANNTGQSSNPAAKTALGRPDLQVPQNLAGTLHARRINAIVEHVAQARPRALEAAPRERQDRLAVNVINVGRHAARDFFHWHSKANEYLETALEPLLEAAETSYRITASLEDDEYGKKLFIGLAARADLLSFVQKKLAANPSMLLSKPEKKPVPVLHYAMEPRTFKFPPSMRTVTLLLEAGADPNELKSEIILDTVWSSFVARLLEDGDFDRKRGHELIRILLLHGADLRAPVWVIRETRSSEQAIEGETRSAEQVLIEFLTPDVANQLFKEIRVIFGRPRFLWITRKQERVKIWYQKLVTRSAK
ncbi:hypothetical protein PG988_012387 [Apiospora saccharicola]